MIGGGLVTAEMMDTTDGSLSNHTRNSITMASHVQSVLGVSRKSAETPPPTYDEALAISQGSWIFYHQFSLKIEIRLLF